MFKILWVVVGNFSVPVLGTDGLLQMTVMFGPLSMAMRNGVAKWPKPNYEPGSAWF